MENSKRSYSKILKIKSLGKKKVYDFSHKIDCENFKDSHPNLIVNGCVISNCGRHAGGILLLEDAEKIMPVVKVRGNLQSPWTEGLKLKTLERLGLLKIDALGLDTLRIIQRCIEKILKRKYGKVYELSIGNEKVEAYENQEILLEDGSWRLVKELNFDDDIVEPIQLRFTA